LAETLIHLREISFSHPGGRELLAQLNLELRQGDRIALMGANGSGKTTLFHLIVGLLHPNKGEIYAFGLPRRSERDFFEVRRRTGLLFQNADDQLFCATVAEDLAFGPLNLGHSRKETEKIVRETLASLGLLGYENRITFRLSGGEKRLVSLAAVLAMSPDVLLLDEPTTGLDPDYVRRLTDILCGLNKTLLVISHDKEFLAQVTTKTLCLKDGQLN